MKRFFSIFWSSSASFEGQETGEEVLMLVRRHPFAIITRVGVSAFALLLPFIIFAGSYDSLAARGYLALFLFLASLWCLFFWLAIFYTLMMYSLNVVIITNHRVIDNDQYALFNRKVAEIQVSKIQDISVHTHGILETFLRFGDVVVQSAGVEKQFTFHQLPNPERVKDAIMKQARKHPQDIRPAPQAKSLSDGVNNASLEDSRFV